MLQGTTQEDFSQYQKHNTNIIETRSDTFTVPDQAMIDAMMRADVGDDVYDIDPTVIKLQDYAADLVGMETSLFMPTGTQSNLTAMMVHCGRGDEVITGNIYHIYQYEARGASILGGMSLTPLPVNTTNSLSPRDIEQHIKADDVHFPTTRLISLENTVNGEPQDLDNIAEIIKIAKKHGLKTHCDGARMMNAAVALGVKPSKVAQGFDSVSMCLSKGLGTPIGTMLCGSKDFIMTAKRIRKLLGGGMRQVGYMAAAGLYALEHNIERLAQDHAHAQQLQQALLDFSDKMTYAPTQHSNMVFIHPKPAHQPTITDFMAKNGVMMSNDIGKIRLVMHKNINDAQVSHLIDLFRAFYQQH